MTKSLLDTQYAITADLKHQIQQVVKFLAHNRNIVIPQGGMAQAFAVRPLVSTSINKLFEQCLATGFINEFATVLPIVRKGEPRTNLPDLLSWTNVTIDLKGNPDGHVLDSFQELKDKILCNVAELVRMEPGLGTKVSDVNELHSMYVRGMFVRSYAQSDGWLTPALCTYLIQTYSLSVSGVIARNENLTRQEQLTIAMLFALYFAQKLSRKGEDLARPSLYFRCTFLDTMKRLDEVATQIAHVSQHGLTIPSICELIQELGPARMQNFNPRVFYAMCTNLGPSTDIMSTRLAFEYPPYWMFLLLRVIDGLKSGNLKRYLDQERLMQREAGAFVSGLITCKGLYDNR